MDAIALLCNLQADGPATLRKLHELGCHSLEDLGRVPVFELADMLGSDTAFAQRFIREGRLLSQRLGTQEPEPEEARVPLAGPAPVPVATVTTALTTPAPTLTRLPTRSPARSAELRERASPQPAELPAVSRQLKPLPNQPPGTRLRAGLLEGLDEEWCRDLIGQGVLSIETLLNAPGLALARAIGRPYPKLVDIQCLAKRFVDQRRAMVTLEREGATEPEVLIPGPSEYTVFPPRVEHVKRITPPISPEERAEPLPDQADPTPKHAQQDAGTSGPFA